MKGTGLNGPKRRLNATCWSGVRRCPRKNSDLVVEDGASHLGDDVVVEVVRQVDATDDRAARTRNRLDGHPPVLVTRPARRRRE